MTDTIDRPAASDAGALAIHAEEAHAAHNYHPLPVVVASGQGAWVTDLDGRRLLDCLAAYSAVNFGHSHPELVRVATEQLGRITLTSRAFHNDKLGPFVTALAELAGKDMVLPMNTGAEAVESGIKVARAWGYRVKGVAAGRAKIIVMAGNFHGRTTTIVSFSDDEEARADFGPFTPGFVTVPYGDASALEAAIDADTVAVLVEPIQGEAGIVVPPEGYLADVRRICSRERVLMIADEIQSGLGRTGATFECDNSDVVPDLYLLGKALGGGIVPVSAVVGDADVLGVIQPGQHGSTFGGNPLAAAVGHAVVDMLATGEPQERARRLGAVLHARLADLVGHGVLEVRGRGLWAGIDIDPALATGRAVCERLAERGVLAKDTHGSTIRLAPPIVVEEEDLVWAVGQLAEVLAELAGR
ncbi:ornithine--oxo-acid transaminase [Clavibacter michiganensis]|uniref:ornithine--oxo-acid transaminase n=1 Tax=Clavibacter michiganensis TaxID=28447 RepID=UPI0009A6B7FE|nr:ornithine--oxo-acid transaminase [Clavibacter michiganensis]MDO4124487.1 ornithine--oxo-acid transaminase [Clavibacter michiganensis]MDO4140623.1 ornithine--oxo-acid transaminase [Clavibacter michiganensis]MWJ05678.1 ornithine--oxo-acid transaminase [Clavibacter michiganensis subsp. michiganensis]MWJ87651.1 ornithine--oxo-acid transaminase [Clavibacter michiganensis subsp. michiganensis]OQJ67256.1 ornithine--oxo-acid transaminase [Clavibacter michiganensis subsp. michiganensis]